MKTEARCLEDFGTSGMKSPKERFEEYKRQCKDLPRERQAKFWMNCMRADPDVAALTNYMVKKRTGT
jgi:hypothetical protein